MDKHPKRQKKSPKQKRSLELVGSIYEASVRILKTLGPDRFSTRSVAELAGISVGSLYQYFPNKDALMGSLIEREARRHVEMIEKKFLEVHKENLETVVNKLVVEILGTVRNDKVFLKSMLKQIFSVEGLTSVIEAREHFVDLVAKILGHFKDEVSADDPQLKAYLIVSALGGIVETIIFRKDVTISEEQLINETSRMILAYCRAG